MSKDELHQTDATSIQPEGENAPTAIREGTTKSGGQLSENASSALEGISQIDSTLDQLEALIAEYRTLLAVEDAAVGVRSDRGRERVASPAEEGETEIISTSPLAVADVPTKEAEVTEAVDEHELLAEPAVDMPALFEELQLQLEMGLHRTASVSVFVNGDELLAYVSSASDSGATPQPAPLFRAFSSGKAMVAATIWRLLDTGVLEIDAPIALYWPEFAQRGKTGVTLRHVLTHTAGLPHDFGRGDVDWGDWGRMIDIIASMPLEYEPGKVIHYHAITFGLLAAEVASRATGEQFVDLFEREVKSPLGLMNTCFAVSLGDRATRQRVQSLHTSSDYHDREMPRKMDWLLENQVVSPGGSCITTASDLAKLYAAVCGGVTSDGELWLSEDAAMDVFATHALAYDVESMSKSRVGQGVWMFDEQPNRPAAPVGSSTFGHGGMGTSIAWGDPDHSIGVAVITDTMQEEELNGRRLNRISAAVRRDLELPVGAMEEF